MKKGKQKMRKLLKFFILNLIQLIEYFEYKEIFLDEDDNSKKILDAKPLKNIKVKTDTGYSDVFLIYKTQPYQIWEIKTKNHQITCADNHVIFNQNFKEVFVKNLLIGDKILTKYGVEEIISIKRLGVKNSMFDLSLNDGKHRFYTNDILSHNTVTSAIFLAWYSIFHFDRNILIVANKFSTAIEIIDKIKQVINNLPFFMKPGVIKYGESGFQFDNNCRVFSQATTSTAALGFAIHLLYADEFAHIHDNLIRPFYRSIYPTLSSSKISKIIISSTPNGKNLFYEIWNNAIMSKNSYKPIRVDWWEVPGRDEEWKEREINDLGSIELFNQEYGNQFLQSNRMLINGDIARFLEKVKSSFEYKEIDNFYEIEFDYSDLIWRKKFSPNRDIEDNKFVLTIDISEGVGQDYSVINIFKLEAQSKAKIRKKKVFWYEQDFFRLRQIGMYRTNKKSPSDVGVMLQYLVFNLIGVENVAIVLETNFKSDVIVDIMERNDEYYPEIFVHTFHSQNAKYPKIGVKTKVDNRNLFISQLKKFLIEKRVIITESDTIDEFSNFGINKRGKFEAQHGHDDIAMTCVLLMPFFESENFLEMVEDIIDKESFSIFRELVQKRIEDGANEEIDVSLSLSEMLNSD